MTGNNMLSDPYIYMVINNAFRNVINKILNKRLIKLKLLSH